MGSEGGHGASANDLVFALCHEIGNLLAAARLEASLLETAPDAQPLAEASERISEISARAGSLLALVRPLLDTDSLRALATDPAEILRGLRRGLDASLDGRVIIAADAAADLPDVAVAAEVLHHLLLNAIFFGLEAAKGDGEVRVSARADGGGVAFVVDDSGRYEPDDDGQTLRGRPLSHAIARALLGAHGGAFGHEHREGATSVSFTVPGADG